MALTKLAIQAMHTELTALARVYAAEEVVYERLEAVKEATSKKEGFYAIWSADDVEDFYAPHRFQGLPL